MVHSFCVRVCFGACKENNWWLRQDYFHSGFFPLCSYSYLFQRRGTWSHIDSSDRCNLFPHRLSPPGLIFFSLFTNLSSLKHKCIYIAPFWSYQPLKALDTTNPLSPIHMHIRTALIYSVGAFVSGTLCGLQGTLSWVREELLMATPRVASKIKNQSSKWNKLC